MEKEAKDTLCAKILDWFFRHYEVQARILAWIGILAIVVLSVVPAVERPVTGVGFQFEHFAAFALVAATFAIGYDLSLARLMLFALVFCAGIELMQVPLPTRHARVSDFAIDFIASCLAFWIVRTGRKLAARKF